MSTAPTGTSAPTIGRSSSASLRAIGTPRVRMPTSRNGAPVAPTLGDPARHRFEEVRHPLRVAEARFRLVHGQSLRRGPDRDVAPAPDRSNHQPTPQADTKAARPPRVAMPSFPRGPKCLRYRAYHERNGPEARPLMKIILANPRGFCAGVNMAIESLELALELFGTPLYVYHEIVHNKYVVERFRAGASCSSSRSTRSPRASPLLYSAHGVSPADPRAGPRAQAAGDRRHLPAGHQGPPRSGPVRQGRLHDPADRPRRARRGDRHDGRSPATA